MSYGIDLQSFENKEISQFKRSIVWDIFGPKTCWTREGWGLLYDGRNGGILSLDDDELIDGCSILRPSNDAIRDLYAVARLVPSAINLDGDFFVANAAVIAGMPDWLLSALPKPPVVVLSVDEFFQRLAER